MSARIGAMILAAGSGSRMGEIKQLILVEGKSLVRRAAQAALDGGCDPVTVVTGAHSSQVAAELAELNIRIASNPAWESGMGSSLRAGLADLRAADPELAAVVILLCDQPNISAKIIRQLIDEFVKGGKPMAACEYAGTIGPPCCFDRSTFESLAGIGDSQGAKSILMSRPADITHVKWEPGGVDLDTPEDRRKFFETK